ncbi:conserved protein, unknown function, partial [Hepatocystis sp. ex Piliocolobus tephrosceles]
GVLDNKILNNLYKFNTNTKNILKNDTLKNSEVRDISEALDINNEDYKYCSYLKPLDIKGIKRADRKMDYNSSYAYMIKQKDYKDNLTKKNIFTTYLYNGMKIPMPPAKYKIANYVDVRLDMFSPIIVCCVICFPFFFTRFMWSVPEGGSGH